MSTTEKTQGDSGERLAKIENTLTHVATSYGERLASIETTLTSHGERLTGIEATLEHMATSEQLQGVITEVQRVATEVSILKWLLGTVAVAVLYSAAKYIVS